MLSDWWKHETIEYENYKVHSNTIILRSYHIHYFWSVMFIYIREKSTFRFFQNLSWSWIYTIVQNIFWQVQFIYREQFAAFWICYYAMVQTIFTAAVCSGLERSPRKRKSGYSNPSRDRPKSFKPVVTDPLTKRSAICVSRVIEDDPYNRPPRVIVVVVCFRTLITQRS